MFGPTTHYRVPFLQLLAVCLLIQFSGSLTSVPEWSASPDSSAGP